MITDTVRSFSVDVALTFSRNVFLFCCSQHAISGFSRSRTIPPLLSFELLAPRKILSFCVLLFPFV